MSSEKFCLKWNDFEANISGAFRELRDDKDFFDVTLACDDDQINAHKVILSACSPFFRTVLRRNPHQHPLLYMKGVRFTDLQSVLNFMYHGEVNVAQEDLNNFLSVAEDLRVKGLTQNQGGGGSSSNSSRPSSSKPPSAESSYKPKIQDVKRPVISGSSRAPAPAPVAAMDDDDIQEVVPQVKTEPALAPAQPEYQHQDPGAGQMQQYDDGQYEEGYEDYGQYDDSAIVEGATGHDASKGSASAELNIENVQSAVENVGGPIGNDLDTFMRSNTHKIEAGRVQCDICFKITAHAGNMKQHFVTHHYQEEAALPCQYCGRHFKNKNSLSSHISQSHKGPKSQLHPWQ